MPKFDIVTRCKGDEELLMPCKATTGSVGYDLKCAEDITVPSTLKHFLKEAHLTGGVTSETPQLMDLEHLLLRMENSYGQRIRPTLVPTGVKIYCEPNEYFAVKSRNTGFIQPTATTSPALSLRRLRYSSHASPSSAAPAAA